jgi:hypothetical protein
MHAMRHSIATAIAVAALSGTAALSGCAAATSAPGATGAAASSAAGAGAGSQAATPDPVVASVPPSATTKPATTKPATTKPAVAKKPATAPTASASAGQHATGTGSSSSGTGSGAGGSGAGSGSATGPGNCQHPVFSTSAQQGGETLDGYYVTNDMLTAGGSGVSQALSACSPASWYVTATMNNGNADVKSYPNAHKDFGSGVAISSLHSVTSSFAQATNPDGVYAYAYDIWINGVAPGTSTEVMIWTSYNGRVPPAFEYGAARFGDHSFTIWKSGDYIAFAATQNLSSGSLNLLQFLDYIIGQGWVTGSATLSQVGYGVQLASTNNATETFSVTNFSVSTS